MTATTIKTSDWFQPLPPDHLRVGISRGTPRGQPAGYRQYRKLCPGPWFNSVGPEEYYALYKAEILTPLNPRDVIAELRDMAGGRIPTLLCFERAGKPGDWCHRAMAAEWLAEATGQPVPEFGFEQLPQDQHPLMPPELRRPIPATVTADVSSFIGRSKVLEGQLHEVTRLDPDRLGSAIVVGDGREFAISVANLLRHFQ